MRRGAATAIAVTAVALAIAAPAAPAGARPPGPGGTTEFYAQLEGRRSIFPVEVPVALLEILRGACCR